MIEMIADIVSDTVLLFGYTVCLWLAFKADFVIARTPTWKDFTLYFILFVVGISVGHYISFLLNI